MKNAPLSLTRMPAGHGESWTAGGRMAGRPRSREEGDSHFVASFVEC
jgi:hypothetical protein